MIIKTSKIDNITAWNNKKLLIRWRRIMTVARKRGYELNLFFVFVNMFNSVSMIQHIMIKHVYDDN